MIWFFTVFSTSLDDLHLPFPTHPQTAKASSCHPPSCRHLAPLHSGHLPGYRCCSSPSCSCNTSCWRSGAVFQQLASTQPRPIGSCSHFEGKQVKWKPFLVSWWHRSPLLLFRSPTSTAGRHPVLSCCNAALQASLLTLCPVAPRYWQRYVLPSMQWHASVPEVLLPCPQLTEELL